MVHAFACTTSGNLVHTFYDRASDPNGESAAWENLTSSASGAAPPVLGQAFVVEPHTDGRMAVIVGSSSAPGPVVLYRQLVAGDAGNWEAEIVATDAWQMKNPHLIAAAWDRIEIAGADASDELIHVLYFPETQNLVSHKVFADSKSWQVSNHAGAIASLRHASGAVDLFAITKPRLPVPPVSGPVDHRDVNGDLLHFRRDSETDLTWNVESVTQLVGSNAYLDPRTSLHAFRQGSTTKVFGVRWFGDLLEFSYGPPSCLFFWMSPSWRVTNVSDAATVIPDADSGSQWIFRNPRFEMSWNSAGDIDVFGLTGWTGEELHHLSFRNGEWWSHNLSRYRYNAHVPNPRLAAAVTESKQHLFLAGENGRTVRFIRAGDSDTWSHEIIQDRLIDAAPYEVRPTIAVQVKEGELHVLGYSPTDVRVLIHLVYLIEGRPWHTSLEYFAWCAGSVSPNDFKFVPKKRWVEDGDTVYANSDFGLFTSDRVELWCPSFASDEGPENRAATLVHESTHHHFHDIDHDDDDRDEWLHHNLGEIDLLTPYDPSHTHSPYQIETEFLADLSQFPSGWVPFIIRQEALNIASRYLNNRFRNDPGWVIGEPRPL
jgi:hypothetical protein